MRFSPTTLVFSLLLAAIVLGCDEGDSPTAPLIATEHVVFGFGATQNACWENLRNGSHLGGLQDNLSRLGCSSWAFGTTTIRLADSSECPSFAQRSDGRCYYCTDRITCRR